MCISFIEQMLSSKATHVFVFHEKTESLEILGVKTLLSSYFHFQNNNIQLWWDQEQLINEFIELHERTTKTCSLLVCLVCQYANLLQKITGIWETEEKYYFAPMAVQSLLFFSLKMLSLFSFCLFARRLLIYNYFEWKQFIFAIIEQWKNNIKRLCYPNGIS